MSGIIVLRSLESYVRECEASGQGISSKDSVGLRFLSLLEASPIPLKASTISGILHAQPWPDRSLQDWQERMTAATLRTLLNMQERGEVRETDQGWIITGGPLDREN